MPRRAVANPVVTDEVDGGSIPLHERMFRTLLNTPHRLGDKTLAAHREMCEQDPDFYSKLAVHAVANGNCAIRDVNEIFLAVLFNSEHLALRDAAYVMAQAFPPYQIARIVNYYAGYEEVVRHSSFDKTLPPEEDGLKIAQARYGKIWHNKEERGKLIPRRAVKLGKKDRLRAKLIREKLINPRTTDIWIDTYCFKHEGLQNRRPTRTLRRAIRTFLTILQRPENRNRLEGALLRSGDEMKTLYVRVNMKPLDWVGDYLFKGKAPEGTRLGAIRQLANEEDPTVQAKIIMDYKIPLTMAVSLVKNLTPSVGVAMISVMSAQELMNSLGLLKKHGLLDNPEIAGLVEQRLKKAAKGSRARVDALKGAAAAKAVTGLDEKIVKAAIGVTDAQIKQHGVIRARTLLAIDRSSSMRQAIQLGKEIAAAIAQACAEGNEPLTYLFNDRVTKVNWKSSDGDIATKSAWDKKLALVKASNGTVPNLIIRMLENENAVVDQILMVTDEGENDEGRFANALKEYGNRVGTTPNVIIARVGKKGGGYPWGSCDRIERSCKRQGIDVEVMPCHDIDQVAIPNLIGLLSRKSIFDLIAEIESIDLPTRENWDEKNLHVATSTAVAVG